MLRARRTLATLTPKCDAPRPYRRRAHHRTSLFRILHRGSICDSPSQSLPPLCKLYAIRSGHETTTGLTFRCNKPTLGSAPHLPLGEDPTMRGVVPTALAAAALALSQRRWRLLSARLAPTASNTSYISSSTTCTFAAISRTCPPISSRCPTSSTFCKAAGHC